MSWGYWNNKQKKAFIISLIIVVITLIFLFPYMKGRGPIPGIAKLIALIVSAGMLGIVELFKNDNKNEITAGKCVKCNKPCQRTHIEKTNQIHYDCQDCGKYHY